MKFALIVTISLLGCICVCHSSLIVPQWQWQWTSNPQTVPIPIDRNQQVWFPTPNFQQQQEFVPESVPLQPLPGVENGKRECGAQCACPFVLGELCGTDGVTYGT